MSDTLPVKGRHLLMLATGSYSDPDVWPDLDVESEANVWAEWLTDPALGDRAFTVAFEDLGHSPSLERVEEVLRKRDVFDKERDVVVCYITGHGERHDGAHHLVLSTSWPDEADTLLETHRVLKWLKTRVNMALVVVDTCFSGDIGTYLSALETSLPPGWVVLAAAAPDRLARLGRMTQALEEFSRTGQDDPGSKYLDYWELMPALAEALDEQLWQPFGTPPPRSRSRLVCLPNRHYRSDAEERVVAEVARQDVAMYEKDLTAHWDPRSRGVADGSTTGTLFTGRGRLMGVLVDAARGEPGVLVVTGGPGCGKSAVLSRLVTFSDPSFRARHADVVAAAQDFGGPLPAVGDVDVAVLAKGHVAQGVLDAIRDRLEIDPVGGETSAQTIDRIHRVRVGLPAVTLVLDALDEAEDPRGILNTVLSPLVSPPDGVTWLRLLVAVRGTASRGDSPGEGQDTLAVATARALSADVVDAAAQFWSSADLEAYVAVLLRAPLDDKRPTPYAEADDDVVDRLAAVVAGIAGTSYVLARLISDQLRRQPHLQDPDDPAWQARAHAGMASVLDEELDADYPDPHQRTRVRSMLTAASLGRGRGVPRRNIWPALATALDPAAETFTDTDIAALLDQHIGGYLTRDVADNATVYRPFHDSLAEALTGPLDQAALHKVTTTLTDLFTVTLVHGLLAPPQEYLRRHLVEHAAESGDLNQIVHNATVLTWTDPDHLLPLLGHLDHPDAQKIGRIYRTTSHTLRRTDGPRNTFALQLRARQAGLNTLADQFTLQLTDTASRPAGRLAWATPRHDSDHHRIDTPSPAHTVTTATMPDGTPVIVSGSYDGAVRVSRLNDGTPIGQPLRGHQGLVLSVVVGAIPDGTPVIVSGSRDGTLRVSRLIDGAPVVEPWRAHQGLSSVAVGVLPDGIPVIVSSGDDRTVQVWRLADGVLIGKPLRAQQDWVSSVAVGVLPDGTPVIVSGTYDGAVRVSRMGDGEPDDESWPGHPGGVYSVAVGEQPDGTPVIVSGGHDHTVRVWRLADGAPIGKPIPAHAQAVTSVAVGALTDGTPVIISGSWDKTVRVWQIADGAPIGLPFRGHNGTVWQVAVGALPDGTPVIVSCSMSETLVWRLAGCPLIDDPVPGHDGPVTSADVNSLAVGALPDGTPVIVGGSYDGTLMVWRLADGTPIGKPIPGDDRPVSSVAVGALSDGTPVIVASSGGSGDGIVRVWRLADGAPIGEPIPVDGGPVCSVAVGVLPDGTPVIISGSYDGTVRVWRLADRAPIGEPIPAHGGQVRSVTFGVLPDGAPVIISGGGIAGGNLMVGKVGVWRLTNGAPIDAPKSDHDGPVSSVAAGVLPDGTPVIISGGWDKTVRVWRLADGAPIGEPIRGHDDAVTSVATGALPDGTPVIISGSYDQTMRVWRLPDGTPVGVPLSWPSDVYGIAALGCRVVADVGGDICVIDLHEHPDMPAVAHMDTDLDLA